MPRSIEQIARRLNRILLADLGDEQPERGSLRIATETLRLIRQTCRDVAARKLARQTLAVLEERAAQATKPPTVPVREPRIINGHILLSPGECQHLHASFPQCCPVCEGGLSVCKNCPEYEAGLDNPCTGGTEPMRVAVSEDDVNDFIDYFEEVPDEAITGLVSPAYRTAAERDVSAVEHAVSVLAESLHLKQPCTCTGREYETCEPCRILNCFGSAMGDAREFLAADGPGEAA